MFLYLYAYTICIYKYIKFTLRLLLLQEGGRPFRVRRRLPSQSMSPYMSIDINRCICIYK